MSVSRLCPSCLAAAPASRLLTRTTCATLPPSYTSQFQARTAASSQTNKKKGSSAPVKKKKTRTTFLTPDVRKITQYSLIDAMRYLRAAEVGYAPTSAKYELHVRLRSVKSGAVVRGRLRLPHPVRTDARICVIAAPDSAAARAATAAGAQIVGEEAVFEAVKDGRIEFDKCLCHQDSLQKLSKANVARILGPRGMMPSAKLGTVVKDVGAAVRDMIGGTEYRERFGVVRMAIGQLGFTPDEMQSNISAFMAALKKDFALLSDRISKEIHEVVLSSTRGPGLSLSGTLRTATSIDKRDLSTV